jgi:hypothetical protein
MKEQIMDKHCFDCNAYQERTTGTGYCSEWDTIVDLKDLCIYEIEAQYISKAKNAEKGIVTCE